MLDLEQGRDPSLRRSLVPTGKRRHSERRIPRRSREHKACKPNNIRAPLQTHYRALRPVSSAPQTPTQWTASDPPQEHVNSSPGFRPLSSRPCTRQGVDGSVSRDSQVQRGAGLGFRVQGLRFRVHRVDDPTLWVLMFRHGAATHNSKALSLSQRDSNDLDDNFVTNAEPSASHYRESL